MWDIVWVSPQGHRSESVGRQVFLKTLQCPWLVRKRFRKGGRNQVARLCGCPSGGYWPPGFQQCCSTCTLMTYQLLKAETDTTSHKLDYVWYVSWLTDLQKVVNVCRLSVSQTRLLLCGSSTSSINVYQKNKKTALHWVILKLKHKYNCTQSHIRRSTVLLSSWFVNK